MTALLYHMSDDSMGSRLLPGWMFAFNMLFFFYYYFHQQAADKLDPTFPMIPLLPSSLRLGIVRSGRCMKLQTLMLWMVCMIVSYVIMRLNAHLCTHAVVFSSLFLIVYPPPPKKRKQQESLFVYSPPKIRLQRLCIPASSLMSRR